MLKVMRLDGRELNVKTSEALRYAGCQNSNDKSILAMLEKCKDEILKNTVCKAVYEEFDISKDNENLNLGFATVKSKGLKKNLEGCEKIVLFAATLGIEPERYLQKSSLISPALALITQGFCTAAIEEWCDVLCNHFEKEFSPFHTRPRFSPGYGDLPLNMQSDILKILDCGRKIGLTLSKNLMMTPSKSVTAIVGLGNICRPQKSNCAICTKKDCSFKKEQ